MGVRRQLTATGAALALAFGSGCMMTDVAKMGESKKPDVTKPGVLPPPQAMVRPASATAPDGGVVQAGGIQPTAPVAVGPAVAPSISPLAKLTARTEKKIPATEMAVAWRNRIAYLPDPSRNGAMGAGLAGQLFLFGGDKLQFALADGTLTVDLIDETPRPAGQPAATPERWQFDKATLRNLRTVDETFGKSYVLFLPWPAYKSDITKVRISARYDPDNGHPLYVTPSVVSIDTSGPLGAQQVWDGASTTTPGGAGGMGPTNRLQPFGSGAPPAFGPIPLGGSAAPANPAQMPLGAAQPGAVQPMMPLPGPAPTGMMPLGNMAPGGTMIPLGRNGAAPQAPPAPGAGTPLGAMPFGPATNEPLLPLSFTAGQK